MIFWCGSSAVEHGSHMPRAGGSNPPRATKVCFYEKGLTVSKKDYIPSPVTLRVGKYIVAMRPKSAKRHQ